MTAMTTVAISRPPNPPTDETEVPAVEVARDDGPDAEGPQRPHAGVSPEAALLEVLLADLLVRDGSDLALGHASPSLRADPPSDGHRGIEPQTGFVCQTVGRLRRPARRDDEPADQHQRRDPCSRRAATPQAATASAISSPARIAASATSRALRGKPQPPEGEDQGERDADQRPEVPAFWRGR